MWHHCMVTTANMQYLAPCFRVFTKRWLYQVWPQRRLGKAHQVVHATNANDSSQPTRVQANLLQPPVGTHRRHVSATVVSFPGAAKTHSTAQHGAWCQQYLGCAAASKAKWAPALWPHKNTFCAQPPY